MLFPQKFIIGHGYGVRYCKRLKDFSYFELYEKLIEK
jgi:hypothetical protein